MTMKKPKTKQDLITLKKDRKILMRLLRELGFDLNV